MLVAILLCLAAPAQSHHLWREQGVAELDTNFVQNRRTGWDQQEFSLHAEGKLQ